MNNPSPARWLPAPLRRYILHFETAIEEAVIRFAGGLPANARVLDAGATDSGRPFSVMELVRGISLTSYVDQHRLPMANEPVRAAENSEA